MPYGPFSCLKPGARKIKRPIKNLLQDPNGFLPVDEVDMSHNHETPVDICPATKEEVEFLDKKLGEFNWSQVSVTHKRTPKNYIIKDKGAIVAGINALIYHYVLYVDVLFVDEKYRRQRLGSTLLKKVEDEAKAMGAALAHLDTFDFQALDFYLKHGYETFGILEDCPKGHKRYYLKKKL